MDAYFHFFLSCDGKVKNNIWMSEPPSIMEKINFKRNEKKRKDELKKGKRRRGMPQKPTECTEQRIVLS
jgi:hypothetical protein